MCGFPKNILVRKLWLCKIPCSPPSLVSIFKSVCLSVYDFNTKAIESSHYVHQKSMDIQIMSLLVSYICVKSPHSPPSLKLNSVRVIIDATACV